MENLALALRSIGDIKHGQVLSLHDLRLFSTGGGSELVEWDIERNEVMVRLKLVGTLYGLNLRKRTISSQGGSIWSTAVNSTSTLLALGCEDGSIRILSIEDGVLQHSRRLDRSKSRILSLAWGPPVLRASARPLSTSHGSDDSDDEGSLWLDSWIVAGCSDSSLRKWDVSSGRITNRMGTDKLTGERTLVWTVQAFG